MRLLEIRLCPFAGLADRRVSLGPQLTVVRGDNETGKTTVFRALECVLFKRTDLTPAKMKDFVRPYLPIGGGDTIAVELRFEHGGSTYQLRREWSGARPGARLTLPDGTFVTLENSIAERMEAMLGATEGTYRSVLLTYQSGLGQTLADLARDGGTTRALGDLLTAAVQETDGVSVAAFKDKLQVENEAFFSHWDSARGGPEGGRGIQNAWKKSVGRVLQNWYEKEARQQAWTEALELEKRVDDLNARLATVTAACEVVQAYTRAHAATAESVAERKTIEAQDALLAERLRTLGQANSEWPVLEQAIGDLGTKGDALAVQLEQLKVEADAARKVEAQKGVRAQLMRVAGRQKQLAEAQAAFGVIPFLDADTLKKIAGLAARCRELQAQLSGGRLTARLTVREPLTFTLRCGADAPSAEQVLPGQPRVIAADGTLQLEHAQWTLAVESGTGNFAGIARELEGARQALGEVLRVHGASNEEEARLLHAACESARQAVAAAAKNLSDELGGKSYEELAAGVAEAGDGTSLRSLVDVAAEQARITAELASLRKDLAAKASRIEELKRAHGNSDKLLETVGELSFQRKELKQRCDALPPLPPGVADANAFVAEYQRKVAEVERQKNEKNGLELERAGIHLPEDSAEELKALYREADEAFAATLRKANVIARIQQAVAEVEAATSAADPYAGLKADVERYVASMTNNRYERIQAAGALPSGLLRNDGEPLRAELLSTGTQDVLGLALRLAMSRHFLDGQNGFLVMDDPLVDMDPRRQAAAAALLAEQSKSLQLIVFTCHPAHAALLGGAAVEL